jgi:hypothetical protein
MKGRTARGRLRAVDAFLIERERALISARGPAPFIDVGFGEEPVTTIDSAESFHALNSELVVIGIEADVQRALLAASSDRPPLLRFVRGDFALLALLPRARLIRVMNVLRSHREEDVDAIHALLGNALVDGGLAVEGSADPVGDIVVAHLLRRSGELLRREALLFHTTFAFGFAPVLFRDWLPRDLRRRSKPGQWVHAFFGRWTSAWEAVRSADPHASFVASVEELHRRGEPVDGSLAARGFMCWRPPDGVPR